jgi:predicted DNA binding CopG/RHH family protein
MPTLKRSTKKAIPRFRSAAAERAFWSTVDSAEYVEWANAVPLRFPQLKPTSTAISLRLPVALLMDLKVLANERDVPYQSLLKLFLAERVAVERRRKRPRASA